MNTVEKLRVLLPHWMQHNAEHAGEFRSWAGRARAAGEGKLAERIEEAARNMEAANHDLQGAVDHLGGAAPAPDHDHTHHHRNHSH